MALPMVHLLAARLWAQDRPELYDCPEFYLGAISPDAVHIRDGNDKSRKDDVHLNNWRRPNVLAVRDYWREHDTPFDIGYGIHVLLDGNWAVGFRRDFPQILLPNGRPDPEIYYNDTCAVDLALYRTSKDTDLFMRMITSAKAPDSHPLLLKEYFEKWVDATIEFYAEPKRPDGKIKFISLEYTLDFIGRCPQMFTDVYASID